MWFYIACRLTCQNGGSPNAACLVCECPPGFTGSYCQSDIDDCSPNPCQNEGVCVDEINSFTCNCQNGFTGSTCGKILLQ